MNMSILENLIAYVPIGMFALAVLWAFIVGLIRGFRKSLILFIQALIAATICIIIFYVLVNNPNTDVWTYKISSNWVNYNDMLGTSTEYSSMKEVIVDYIITKQSYGDGMRLIIRDNGAYLDTLVNLVYRIVLFIPLIIVFFVLDFIFYLIYLIFYPERRRVRKIRKEFRENNRAAYKKHSGLGGLVGAIRGAVVGIVWLSFIGALFFIVAGGTGDDKDNPYPDYSFADENLANTYEAYKIVGSYGNTGLFRILNTFKDSENVPYYLFAANMILSGSFNDNVNNVHTTVRFTKELSCYTNFVNRTLKLVLKYDETGEISKAIEAKDQEQLTNFLNKLMEKEEFKKEYDALIDSFDSGTYFINFAISFVNSVVAHRNKLAFTDNLSDEVIGLLDVIFDGDHKIMVSDILTESDAKHLMKSVITVLSVQAAIDENADTTQKTLIYSKAFIPQFLELSLFKDESRKDRFNPLLGDIYEYLANNTIKSTPSTDENLAVAKFDLSETLAETNANSNSISWVDELKMLLETSLDLVNIADSVYDKDAEILDLIFDIFPEDNEELKNINISRFDNLINNLSNSKLLDSVLSMTIVKDKIDSAIASISEGIKIPKKIDYANVYDDDGNIEKYGEINVLLTALKELILSNDAKDIIVSLKNKEFSQEIIKSISQLFTEPTSDDSSTLIDISLRSTVLKYIISGVFLDFEEKSDLQFTVVIPSNLCVTDDEDIVTIKDEELKNLFNSLVGTLDIFGENDSINFKKIVDNVASLSTSQIIEASVVNVIITSLEEVPVISIPDSYLEAGSLDNLKGDYSTNIWHTKSEISNIIYAIDEVFNVSDLDTFDLEESMKEISSKFANLTTAANKDSSRLKLDIVYDSAIIRSTIKKFVTDQIGEDIIDQNLLNSSAIVEEIDGVPSIKKVEVKNIIYSAKELALDLANLDFSSLSSLITSINGAAITPNYEKKIDVLYDSTILRFIITKQLDKTLSTNENLIAPAIINSNLVKTVETYDENDYKAYSKAEITALVNSIDVFEITDINNIDAETIKNTILDFDSAKIDKLYESYIIKYAIAKQLDTAITTEVVALEIKDSELVKDYNLIDSTNYGYYREEELLGMINSLKVLSIDDIDNIDASTIKNTILDFDAIKINTLYESYIIKYAIAKQLDTAITSTIVADEVRDSDLVKDYKIIDENNYGYYKANELLAMIRSLKELAIDDIDNFTVADIKTKIATFNDLTEEGGEETKLDVLYSSYVIKYAISERFDQIFKDATLHVSNVILDDNKSNNELDSHYYYKELTVKKIIDAFGVNGLNITNLDSADDIDANTILTLNEKQTGSTKTRLEVVYDSDIIAYILSDKLKEAIDSNTYLVDDIDAKDKYNDSSVYLYKQSELASLIKALNDLGLTDVNDFDSSSITINDSIKADINSSVILFDTVSKIVFGNASLVTPVNATIKNSDNTVTKIVNEEQMNYLLDTLISLGVTGLTGEISLTLNNSVITNISKSYILRATVSDKIINNANILVSTSVIDTTVITDVPAITEAELENTLNAILVGLGISDVSTISATISLPGKDDTTKDARLTAISKSQIIRTTITDKIEFKNGTEPIALQLVEEDTDLLVKYGTTDKLLSLKEDEMVKLLNGIITTFGGSSSTSTSSTIDYTTLLAMSDDDFASFIESSTIRIITANLLGTTYVYGAYTYQCGVKSKTPKSEKELDVSVYSTTTKTTSTIDFYNDVTQKDIVSTLRGVTLP